MSKKFDIGAVLSVTTGKLLCPFDELHEALDGLTGESLFTHQLPRAAESARAYVFSIHPELKSIEVPEIDGTSEERAKQVKDFLDSLVENGYPRNYEIETMKDFESKNPLQELIEMRGGTDGIIPVIID